MDFCQFEHLLKWLTSMTAQMVASVYNVQNQDSIPGSGRSPGEGMATYSSTLAWKIPWMEEPGRLQSMGSQRVRHDWVTSLTHSSEKHWAGSLETWVQVQVLLVIILSKSLHLSEPPLPYWENNAVIVLGLKRETVNGNASSDFPFCAHGSR